jgi:GNAT superfamily N-acetyltransferase
MNRTEQKWSVRVYTDGDEEGILDLWKAVYPERKYERQQWMTWWQWMYRDNPNGLGVILLADHDGRIVAHTAEIPMMMKVGSEKVLAGIGLHAMTHPDYRRQGTYAALAKARRLESEKRGMHVEYAFHNKFSYPYPGLPTKVGMFDGATLQKVFRPLDWRAAIRTQTRNKLLLTIGPAAGALLSMVFFRPRKTTLPEGISIAQVPQFDERIDELWNRVSSQYHVAVFRNRAYLNWRYVAVPDRHYSIYLAAREHTVAGYLVLNSAQTDQPETGVIVDVIAESREVAEHLISAAVEHCRQEKGALLWSARVGETPLATAYRRGGFLSAPFNKKSITISAWSDSPSIAKQLHDPENWFIQMGDSDEA